METCLITIPSKGQTNSNSKAVHQLQKAQIRESIDKIWSKIKPVTEQMKGPMYVI